MAMSTVPIVGKILYRPVRVMMRPDPMDVIMSPAISGRMRMPEFVALACPTVWR